LLSLVGLVVALCAAQQRFGDASAASDNGALSACDDDGIGDGGDGFVLPARPGASAVPLVPLTSAGRITFEPLRAPNPHDVTSLIFRPPISDLA